MSLPHLDRPICEPVDLPPGAAVRAEHIRQGHGAVATRPFVHFHDVHELVLFGRVEGSFMTERRRYALAPHSVVFVPSMQQHDFALAPGPRDWTLVQVEAGAGEAVARTPGLERLRQPLCARPGHVLWRRLKMIAEWLVEVDATDTMARPLTDMLLHAVVQAPAREGMRLQANSGSLSRLRPAIDQLRQHPADAPGAERAAALCALSPAYFSRRFKQQVGMSWSDYVRTHRLHLASRQLLETDRQVVTIACDLGFSTPSHFGELFRRRFGVTPSEYRHAGQSRRERTRRDG